MLGLIKPWSVRLYITFNDPSVICNTCLFVIQGLWPVSRIRPQQDIWTSHNISTQSYQVIHFLSSKPLFTTLVFLHLGSNSNFFHLNLKLYQMGYWTICWFNVEQLGPVRTNLIIILKSINCVEFQNSTGRSLMMTSFHVSDQLILWMWKPWKPWHFEYSSEFK